MATKSYANAANALSKAQLSSFDYIAESKKISEFIGEFSHVNPESGLREKKYMPLLQKISNRESKLLEISLDDISEFDTDGNLLKHITNNTMRYTQLFSDAIDLLLPPSTANFDSEDVFDVLMNHRLRHLAEDTSNSMSNENLSKQFPPALTRRFELVFVPLSKEKPLPVRDIKSAHVGKLVSVKGIVTRVTDVKPMITVATYTCDQCGFEIYQEVNGKTFLPIFDCTSQKCATNQVKGKVYMQTRGSKFVKYQEVKIQELAEQVPIGHIPRSMNIILKGEMTRTCSPGDIVTISGIFLPTPFTGKKAVRAGLIADTYLDASHIEKLKKKYSDYVISEESLEVVNRLASDPEVYSKLSRSIAPEIFGHEDVKKALVLLLVGGVTKVMPDRMKIRGDVNICLMGDPGVAKSQLLKQISVISPRGVYTTGKGSSGVGLTAAVMRDSTTNDLVLEGGALVLADLGVCCIDEFDKMEESDRTAIHEVMEQQTVSIAKAGITTTLNARTSILAAANPLYGRYNPHKSPTENINLPAALLSRFDLLFLIVDQARPETDFALAKHVTYVHMHGKPPELEFEPVDSNTLRSYISQARRLQPSIPASLSEFIVEEYVAMRQEELENQDKSGTYTSARTLLGILRLAQALARLRFDESVSANDINESIRLMRAARQSLNIGGEKKQHRDDWKTSIYTLIREHVKRANSGRSVKYQDILQLVLNKGYKEDQLRSTIDDYERLDVWQLNKQRTHLTFVV